MKPFKNKSEMNHRIVVTPSQDADLMIYVDFLREALGKEFANTAVGSASSLGLQRTGTLQSFDIARNAYSHIRGQAFGQQMTASVLSIYRAKTWWAGSVSGLDLRKGCGYREFAFLLDDEILAVQLRLMLSN